MKRITDPPNRQNRPKLFETKGLSDAQLPVDEMLKKKKDSERVEWCRCVGVVQRADSRRLVGASLHQI